MTEALELFKFWLLIGCQSLGVMAPPVEIAIIPTAWAKVCINCEVQTVYVSTDLLCYADEEYIQSVAFHEACHIKLGHNKEWFKQNTGKDAEAEVDECIPKLLGVKLHYIKDLDILSARWIKCRPVCNPVKHLPKKEKEWIPKPQ